eukprot:scaffold112525_cov60-Phaeocystis_antarctica.AAC.1
MVEEKPSAPPEQPSDPPPDWEALSAMSASQLKVRGVVEVDGRLYFPLPPLLHLLRLRPRTPTTSLCVLPLTSATPYLCYPYLYCTPLLKAVLRERGVPTDDCFEKADLQARARTLSQ